MLACFHVIQHKGGSFCPLLSNYIERIKMNNRFIFVENDFLFETLLLSSLHPGCLVDKSSCFCLQIQTRIHSTVLVRTYIFYLSSCSVADPNPDPLDPYEFGSPGSASGSISQRYVSGSFYHQAKIVRKTLIPIVLWLLYDFMYLWKTM